MIAVRTATSADAEPVAAIRAASWRSAYADMVPDDVLARFTSPEAISARVGAMRKQWPPGIVIAEIEPGTGLSDNDGHAVRAGDDASLAPQPVRRQDAACRRSPAVGTVAIGFAHAGPEREQDSDGSEPETAGPVQQPGQAGPRAELYAIYVLPAYWSTGAGHALMDGILRQVQAEGYAAISLWVLAENHRARRFYERAGFSPTGQSLALDWLGGATEVQYLLRLS